MADTPTSNSKEPKYSRFTQQELSACKPLLTPSVVIAIFFTLAVIFIPIGAVCLQASSSVVDVSKRYDDICIPDAVNNEQREKILNPVDGVGEGTQCTVTLLIEKDMEPPIFMYYELNNYYQNHRRYVKSRSDAQLRGDENAISDLDDCPPQKQVEGIDGAEGIINPCGLIAWSFFNDTYALKLEGGDKITTDETGIAWKSDKNDKFGSFEVENFNNIVETRGGGTITGPLNDNEHFLVWMRTATLPNFRKLWARIDTPLKKGETIEVAIKNRYNTYRFDGQKKIVLSTASWLGGKNNFLGIAYLVIGSFCVFAGIVFLFIHMNQPRALGDVNHLSWKK